MPSQTYRGNARFAGLSSQEVDRLLALCDGDAALVYMYVRRQGLGRPEAVPGISEARLRPALRRLAEVGLLENDSPEEGRQGAAGRSARPCPDTIPSKALLTRPDFTMVLAEAERLLGRTLSPSEVKLLYSIFEWRGLPPGVIMLLLNYCVDDVRRRLGENAHPPSVRQIDREAALWQEEGLRSEEAAEAYIRRQEQARSLSAQSYKRLGLQGRSPSESEKKYVQSWISMGFEPDAIAVAYDITVLKTGKLTWKYCDTILRRWHEEGLHSRAEIEAREAARNGKAGGKSTAADTAGSAAGLAHTKKALERVRAHARKNNEP